MGRIIVMGLGYVGLPLAVLFARRHDVIGVDTNPKRVAELNEQNLFISEADIQDAFKLPDVRRNFRAQAVPEEAQAFVIAVPTPLTYDNVADLSYVRNAIEAICPYLRKGNLVVVESTVPPLTCRTVVKSIIEKVAGWRVPQDVLLAYCPERVLPGNLVYELIYNDRVFGGVDAVSAEAAKAIYSTFVEAEIFLTDDVTAELCKLAENAHRDVNVAFANELGLVAEQLGVDTKEVVALANRHPRVEILDPGIGVGGHCLPIDPWFIHQLNKEHSKLIRTARLVNDSMPRVIADKLEDAVRDISDPQITLVGLAYKPDVADTRESPALAVCEILRRDGYQVASYDPLVEDRGYHSLAEIARGMDCLGILVEHGQVVEELEATEAAITGAMRTPRILRF